MIISVASQQVRELLGNIDIPFVVYKNCEVIEDETGMPSPRGGTRLSPLIEHGEIVIDIAFRDKQYINHYFHFMELMIAAEALRMTFFPDSTVGKVFFADQKWNVAGQNYAQAFILDAVMSPDKIFDAQNWRDGDADLLLVIDRQSGGRLQFNKFVEPYYELACGNFQHVRAAVHRKANCRGGHARPQPKAIYIKRSPPRNLISSQEERLLQEVSQAGFDVESVDFAALTIDQQVRKAHSAFLMIGVHGNGLTNGLWLQEGAFLLELFAAGVHHYDYQMFAEIGKLNYFGVEGVSAGGYIATNGSRFGPSTGDSAKQVDQLPIREIRWVLASAYRAWTAACQK